MSGPVIRFGIGSLVNPLNATGANMHHIPMLMDNNDTERVS